MKYSIVIPTYNRASLLADALESLSRLNTSPALFEVVIVDDGSTDNTDEVVHSYKKRAKHSVVFVKQTNGGPSSARNAGIQRAIGEYVALTDSDCVVAPDWLDQLIASFTDTKVAGVGGSTKSLQRDVFSRYFDYWGTYNTRSFPNSSEINYLLTCNACYRKRAVEEVGLFNTCFTVPGGEDPELCIRLRQKGYKLLHNPQAIIFHNHKSSAAEFIKTFFNYGIGKARIEKLHGIWGDKRSLEQACVLSSVAETETALTSQLASKDDASVFSVLKYTQDLALYLGYRHTREEVVAPDGVSNLFIFFHAGQEKALDLLLAQLLAADEGIHYSYTIWFAGPAPLYQPSSTLKTFLSAKKALLRFGVPNVDIPHELKVDDPNQVKHTGNHSLQPKDLKLRYFHFNSMIYEAIALAEPFLLLYPESLISGNGWLKRLNEDYIAARKPALFSPTRTGLLGGSRVANRFAGYGIYNTNALRPLFTMNDFKQRTDNPWWPLREDGKADNLNNCFWGPLFSAYDVTFNYFAFAKLLTAAHPDATANKPPSQWPKYDHEPTAIASYSETKSAGLQLETLEHTTAALVGDAPLPSLHRNLKRLQTRGRKPLFSYPLSGPVGAIDHDNDTALSLDELRDRFAGHRCFIIGNGPSLKKTDMRLLRNEFTIGFNRIYLNYENMGFEPTFFCAINKLVLQQYAKDIDRLKSIKFLSSVEEQAFSNHWNTFFMSPLNYRAAGFVTDLRPQEWYEGWTVTYAGMQLAYFLGFSEVVLIGVDHFFGDTGDANKIGVMNQSDTNHFHPDYFAKGVTWQYPDLARSEESYTRAKKYFDEKNASVIDATVGGHLTIFPKKDYLSIFENTQAQPISHNKFSATASLTAAPEPIRIFPATAANKFDISVIIPVRNASRFLSQAIESALEEVSLQLEVIVVDDGSTDNSIDIAQAYSRRDNRVRVVSNTKSQGVSGARNTGIAAAKGAFIAFLDADDAFLHGALAARFQYIKENNADLVHSIAYLVSEEGRDLDFAIGVKRICSFIDAHGSPAHLNTVLLRTSSLGHFEFNEAFTNGEDWLYLASILRSGIKSHYVDKAGAYYRVHAGSAVNICYATHESKLVAIIDWLYSSSQEKHVAEEFRLPLVTPSKQSNLFGRRATLFFARFFKCKLDKCKEMLSDLEFRRYLASQTVDSLINRMHLPFVRAFQVPIIEAKYLDSSLINYLAIQSKNIELSAMLPNLIPAFSKVCCFSIADNIYSVCVLGPYDRNDKAHIDETKVVGFLFKGKSQGVMIDVGVMNGCSSIPFLDEGWRVWGFEPDNANRSSLIRALSSHPKRQSFTLDTRCVSNQSQQGLAFYRSAESTGISGLSAFRDSHTEAQRVDSVSLTDYFKGQEMPAVDFLKIDTEGHDLFVLQGFPWERNRPRVIECEFEDLKTKPLGYTTKDMADFLIGKGYTVYVSEWHPILKYGQRHDWHRLQKYPCELSCYEAWGNLLAFSEPPDEAKLVAAIKSVLKSAPKSASPSGPTAQKNSRKNPEVAACFTPVSSDCWLFMKKKTGQQNLLIFPYNTPADTVGREYQASFRLVCDFPVQIVVTLARHDYRNPFEGATIKQKLTPGENWSGVLKHRFRKNHADIRLQFEILDCPSDICVFQIQEKVVFENSESLAATIPNDET